MDTRFILAERPKDNDWRPGDEPQFDELHPGLLREIFEEIRKEARE